MRHFVTFNLNNSSWHLLPARILEAGQLSVRPDEFGRRQFDHYKLSLDVESNAYAELVELQYEYKQQGSSISFYTVHSSTRTYTAEEFENARLFMLNFNRWVNASAEDSGTIYDESSGCPVCKFDWQPVGGLVLPSSKLPKSAHFACTWVPEPLARSDVAQVLGDEGLTGLKSPLTPVISRRKSKDNSPDDARWFHLEAEDKSLQLSPTCWFGSSGYPRGDDSAWRHEMCPLGHSYGFSLVGRPIVVSDSYCGDDIVMSHKSVGVRRGVLAPFRRIFVSRRFRELYIANKWTGLVFEPALEEGAGLVSRNSASASEELLR